MTLTADPTGTARSPGVSYQQLLDADSRPVPDVLRWEAPAYFGDEDKPIDRYISRDVHELEKERLWTKVWQMACRESELADVGDSQVYDITDISILLVRSGPDRDQGLLQRLPAPRPAAAGRPRSADRAALPVPRLRLEPGRLPASRCRASGTSRTCDRRSSTCPRSRSAPGAGSSSSTWTRTASPSRRSSATCPSTSTAGRSSSATSRPTWPASCPTNWKTVQEAFMEAYHVVATHPQLLPGIGDANSQYDVWGNFSRAITPNGTPSPHLRWEPTEQEMFDSMSDRRLDKPPLRRDPRGQHGAGDRREERPGDDAAVPRGRGRPADRRRDDRLASITRSSPTCTRGGRTTGSSTASGRTRTTTRWPSWSASSSRPTTRPPAGRRTPRSTGSASTTTGPRRRSSDCWPGVQPGLLQPADGAEGDAHPPTQQARRHDGRLPGDQGPPLPRAGRGLARPLTRPDRQPGRRPARRHRGLAGAPSHGCDEPRQTGSGGRCAAA